MIYTQHEFFITRSRYIHGSTVLFSFSTCHYPRGSYTAIRFRSFRSVARRDAVAPLVFPLSWPTTSRTYTSSAIFVHARRRSSLSHRHPSPSWRSAHQSTSRSRSADRHGTEKGTRGDTFRRQRGTPSLPRVAEKDVCDTRVPDRRLVGVALSLIYNPHPRALDGRFIRGARPRVRVTFWIWLARKWWRLSAGLRTHRFSVLRRLYSLSPSTLLASACLFRSLLPGPLLRRRPQFAGRRTQGGTDALSTSRGHPEYARVLPSRDCLVLDSHVLTTSFRDIYMFEPLLFATVVLWEHVRSPFVVYTYTHTRARVFIHVSCVVLHRKKNPEDQGKGISNNLNVQHFHFCRASLCCVGPRTPTCVCFEYPSVTGSWQNASI